MTFPESSGEEWKEGTEYEEDLHRIHRELVDALEELARGFGRMADAARHFREACARVWAERQLTELGFEQKRAREFVYSLQLVAEAEQRSLREVAIPEIQRIRETLEHG